MAKTLDNGDAVSRKSQGGKAHGKIVRKITMPIVIKGHKAAASKEHPQFLVETNEGKQAGHKAKSLKNN